jgi:hypothetical protein
VVINNGGSSMSLKQIFQKKVTFHLPSACRSHHLDLSQHYLIAHNDLSRLLSIFKCFINS